MLKQIESILTAEGEFVRAPDALGLFPAYREAGEDTGVHLAIIDLPNRKLAIDVFYPGYEVFVAAVEEQRNHIVDLESFVGEAMAEVTRPFEEMEFAGHLVPSYRDLPNDLARWGAMRPAKGEPVVDPWLLPAARRIARNLRAGKILLSYPGEPRQRSTKVLKSTESIWLAGRIVGA